MDNEKDKVFEEEFHKIMKEIAKETRLTREWIEYHDNLPDLISKLHDACHPRWEGLTREMVKDLDKLEILEKKMPKEEEPNNDVQAAVDGLNQTPIE